MYFVTSINIRQLLSELSMLSYNPDEWRSFIDSSTRTLKCVFLCNGNLYRSIPIGHSMNFHAFFVCVIVVQNTSTWSKGNFSDILEVGQVNIINQPLVDHQKIVFPPLYTKEGLIKQSVKALIKENDCFKYLCGSFPGLSEEN